LPLARELEAPIFMPLVRTSGQMEGVFDQAANFFRIDKCQEADFITSYFLFV